MSIQTKCDMHMKMFYVLFDLVVPPLWLPLWSILSSFYMSSHCDLSSHNLCNVCHSLLYYLVFLLVLLVMLIVSSML
jgi:hypothetical protein